MDYHKYLHDHINKNAFIFHEAYKMKNFNERDYIRIPYEIWHNMPNITDEFETFLGDKVTYPKNGTGTINGEPIIYTNRF